MSLSNLAALLTLASVICTVASPSAEAANKRRSTIAARGHHTGFVPPPPAYMPSILPELYMRGGSTQTIEVAEAKKVDNPYNKYVQVRVGDEVKATSSRKGVSTWAPLRIKKSS